MKIFELWDVLQNKLRVLLHKNEYFITEKLSEKIYFLMFFPRNGNVSHLETSISCYIVFDTVNQGREEDQCSYLLKLKAYICLLR